MLIIAKFVEKKTQLIMSNKIDLITIPFIVSTTGLRNSSQVFQTLLPQQPQILPISIGLTRTIANNWIKSNLELPEQLEKNKLLQMMRLRFIIH